ncbi:MAG: amino acid permease [Propionibacteriaceae bacterium]|nr:amino acid permease [Propionibacteriaceae bacterium]
MSNDAVRADVAVAGDEPLKRDLKARHLTMISIGGVIGAGYFLGAGGAIQMAGPAVVIAYFVGGFVTILVMTLLSEMAVAMPVAGSFQVYASKTLGRGAGFVTGWTYWFAFLIGPASETIAAGTFLHLWFPVVPIWVFSLVVAALMTVVNIIGVLVFGEVEFWLSLIKVVALVAFIVWGCIAVFGLHIESANFSNLWGASSSPSGFAPMGVAGVVGAMLIVFFSYGGTEAIGTAAEESHNPARDIPRALTGTVVRIVVLYVISIGVLIMVVPWEKLGISSSPYVDAVTALGGPVFGNIMNFVVLTAALSCIDTGVYATSRMLYSLSRDHYFPAVFSRVNEKRKVPVVAAATCCAVLFLGALCAYFWNSAYLWLAGVSGFGFLFAWLMIVLSQPGMRKIVLRDNPSALKWKAPFTPWIQYLAVLLIVLVFVGQFFIDGGWKTMLAGGVWLVIAILYYVFVARRSLARAGAV